MGQARQFKVKLTIKSDKWLRYQGASLGCRITSMPMRGNERDLTGFLFSHLGWTMPDRNSLLLTASVAADRRDGVEC